MLKALCLGFALSTLVSYSQAQVTTDSPADASTTASQEPTLPPNFQRKKPAYIIVKLDDLKCNNSGMLPPNWQKIADEVKARQIKVNIGIICNSLEGPSPSFDNYVQWIKDLHATGNYEFWLHAYDHMNHIDNGLSYAEFDGRTYDECKQRFATCEKLAVDKLGFPLTTFGPPGFSAGPGTPPPTVHTTANLDRAIQDDPNLTAWLYPPPLDDEGKTLAAQGKVTILDRVWRVNIEQPVFKPNYAKFVDGYGKYPDREYFVIQGHPGHWKDTGFIDFHKILDFLQKQNAIFVTATEMAVILKKEGASATTDKQ